MSLMVEIGAFHFGMILLVDGPCTAVIFLNYLMIFLSPDGPQGPST